MDLSTPASRNDVPVAAMPAPQAAVKVPAPKPLTVAEYKETYSLDLSKVPVGTYAYMTPAETVGYLKVTRSEWGAWAGWTFVRFLTEGTKVAPDPGKDSVKIATQHVDKGVAVWSARADRRAAMKAPLGYAGLLGISLDPEAYRVA